MARYVMHEGVLISSFAIHAIHPCMPALYVADVASDAIGELYSSHTYVVEPGYVPDYARIIDCDALLLMRQSAVFACNMLM